MTGAIGGVDHCIVLVRDLAAARDVWERLGFRTSPRGVHSAHMGTANHTIMLADDYIELLGTVSETAENARWRTRLAGPGEGLVAIALRAFDAPKAAEEVATRGFAPLPVLHFGRAVALPGPGAIEATFDVFHLRDMLAEEVRVFFCRHNVPGATWPPGLTEHPNGAVAIESFTILAEDPRTAAEATAKLLGRTVAQADGAMVVETGRARLRFREKGAGRAGIDAIAVRVRDLEVARAALAAGGIEPAREDSSLAVPREAANGVRLSFVRA